MIKPKSLQQRFVLYLLIPVAVLLIGMGIVGLIYARNSLLSQWREAAVLKLKRAAHEWFPGGQDAGRQGYRSDALGVLETAN